MKQKTPFDRTYLATHVQKARGMENLAAAIQAWEPKLSLQYRRANQLGHPSQTLYAMLISEEAVLRRFDMASEIHKGDLAVIAPGVFVPLDRFAEFLIFGYDGSPPMAFGCEFVETVGYETYIYRDSGAATSHCGIKRSEILPMKMLRQEYRVPLHFVEIQEAQPHLHIDMVEFYYVLYGEGTIGIGENLDSLDRIAVRPGSVVAVGTNLYHPASNGLGMSIFFLYPEAVYRQKVRD